MNANAVTRLQIVHRTNFAYARTVSASYNEARMRPVNSPGQSVLEAKVTAHPSTYASEYRDYWGTHVSSIEILTPHTELEVVAASRVELSPIARPSSGASWDTLRAPDRRDRMSEFLATTPTTAAPEQVRTLAREVVADLPPEAAAEAICRAVRAEIAYVPGVTGVHTRAAQAWEARQGVCQDLAHLVAGALREVGIPTRYVSGYLHPQTSGAEIGVPVTGESHAWVEFWSGDWFGFDPTNLIRVDAHHVVVARGREYGDVSPMRGVYAGGGASTQEVEVTITREA